MPATLALTLGSPATFAPFIPGVAQDYLASTTATVISTAADATLTVSDPGHLANGAYELPSPLQVTFAKSAWTETTPNDTRGHRCHITSRTPPADTLRKDD